MNNEPNPFNKANAPVAMPPTKSNSPVSTMGQVDTAFSQLSQQPGADVGASRQLIGTQSVNQPQQLTMLASPFGQQSMPPTGNPVSPDPVSASQLSQDTGACALKKLPKKFIVMGIAGLIAVALAVGVYMLIFRIKPQDYDEVVSSIGDIIVSSDATPDVNIYSLANSDNPEKDILASIDNYNQSVADKRQKLNGFGQLKAIRADSRAKVQYDKMMASYSGIEKKSRLVSSDLKKLIPIYLLFAQEQYTSLHSSRDFEAKLAGIYRSLATEAVKISVNDDKMNKALQKLPKAANECAEHYEQMTKGSNSEMLTSCSDIDNIESDFNSFMDFGIGDAVQDYNMHYAQLTAYLSSKMYGDKK